ncbi:MAG: DNA-binding protein [Gammaproteobacteria bacterium]|nr:DNA-binding protein [Gammaproteobacteria bacterium]
MVRPELIWRDRPVVDKTTGDYSMAKKNAAPTKSQIVAAVAAKTNLSKKQVSAVLEALGDQIKKSLKGNGVFTLPGLCKMRVVRKAATKAREGVNPFTGEKMTINAKPASRKVRIRALKNLNEMVG